MTENNNKYIDINTGQVYESAESALTAQREKQKQEEYENTNKNPAFIQLTKGVSPEVIANIASESATAIQVLMFFFKNMDDYNVIVVSQTVIAESIESTTRSVARAIKVLENHGAIGIGKVGTANVYLINPHIAWQKKNNQRQTAVLKANVILGKEESQRLQERFGGVYKESQTKSLKVDNLATKIAIKQPKNMNSYESEFELELSEEQAFYEEFEQNREDEERLY